MHQTERARILFISHSYPPLVGGVESHNYNLAQALGKISQVKVLANGKGKLWLPIFLPVTFFRALVLMKRFDYCLVGNGVLAPLAFALKLFYPRKKFFSVVHGLDITFIYKKGLLPLCYKWINLPSLKKMDRLFVVSCFTISEAVRAGIPMEKCVLLPNGVFVEKLKREHSRQELSDLLGFDTKENKILLRLARFVPHKGTAWFIEHVMPFLSAEVVLVATGYRVGKNTAGDPDNYADCERLIKEKRLEDRVKLLPNLPQDALEILLNTVDLVIAPNIEYPGSSEGFGINAIEAGACERVVLASNLQGLADAIQDGKNGFLVESGNSKIWIEKLESLLSNDFPRQEFGRRAGMFVWENFTWEKIAEKYLREMKRNN